jgi:hypothetical protein
LGIGTNTPSRKLHVIGTSALFQNAGAFELDLLNTTSGNYLRATAGATDANIGTIQNIPFSFIMNGTRVGQFTSTNGNLILQNGGTFSDGGQRLQVQGNAIITTTSQLTAISSIGGLFISNSSTSANGVIGLTGAGFILQGKDGASTSYPLLLQPYGSNVGIGTTSPSASAILQADSTTKGFLPPRMTTTQRNAISSPATGLFLYDSTDNEYEYYNGTAWTAIQSKLTNPVTGTGTTNFLPKWTSSSALGNSLVYDNGTNVLINTTSDSGQKLQVNGTIKADGRIFINAGNGNQLYLNNAGERYTQITFDNNSTSISQAYLAWDSVANFFEMYAKIGGGLKFYANQSEAMIITTSSFVGIGTSTPSYKLDVNRSSLGTIAQFITLDGTYNPRLLISGTAEGIQLFATYSSGGAEALMFGTANSEKMRLTSNLLIGGTVDSGERLQVTGSAKITGDVNISGVFRETLTTNRQTASYTLALADNGKLVEMNVATANNLTVPLNSSVTFPIGTKIDIAQYGAGQTTIVATSGVTVRSAGGALKLAVQYSGGSLVKIGTDEWYLFGDITV